MTKPYIVGITGGSGSGKTYLLQQLLSKFKHHEICLLSQDNYYHSIDKQPIDGNGIQNFDLPESINLQQFASDIETLKTGKNISIKEYTFNNDALQPNILTLKAAPVLVVEGIFVFYHPEIANNIDLKIFIDAKEYIKLKRRISRDQVERGYDTLDVLYRYENHVAPAFEKYIEPLKHKADIIIPNNANFDIALEMVIAFLKTKIL